MSTTVINTPEGIQAFRLLAIKGALYLETRGMRATRMSATGAARQVLGSKTRNKAKLYAEYVAHLKQIGVLAADAK